MRVKEAHDVVASLLSMQCCQSVEFYACLRTLALVDASQMPDSPAA
jgi:hypothetical protein